MFDLQNHNITDKISSDRLDDIGLTLQLNPRRILDSTKTTQQTKKNHDSSQSRLVAVHLIESHLLLAFFSAVRAFFLLCLVFTRPLIHYLPLNFHALSKRILICCALPFTCDYINFTEKKLHKKRNGLALFCARCWPLHKPICTRSF